MYLRKLHLKNLKLVRELTLDFTGADGRPRMWTALIGENGTCKTAILQAIAMAAASSLHVNTLARPLAGQLRDRRCETDGRAGLPMKIRAEFGFSDLSTAYLRKSNPTIPERPIVVSKVKAFAGESAFRAEARFEPATSSEDPLVSARAASLAHWFVAGYGIQRVFPEVGLKPTLQQSAVDRIATLFDPRAALTSLAFMNYYADDVAKSQRYARVLKKALFHASSLLPGVRDLELRGQGGVRRDGDLMERNRFVQSVGGVEIKVPAGSLSHGYQSTIAWISDFVGHVVLEADDELRPDDMVGCVLVDELDLYLHPTWQIVLVRSLQKTFPRMQFIVSTHSPLVLAGLQNGREEIVRLGFHPETGDIVRIPMLDDPRLLTGTELYKRYFSIDDIYPDEAGRDLRDYAYLAANPFRSDDDERTLKSLRRSLQKQKVSLPMEPVTRRPR